MGYLINAFYVFCSLRKKNNLVPIKIMNLNWDTHWKKAKLNAAFSFVEESINYNKNSTILHNPRKNFKSYTDFY